jgi:elongation factor P
VQFLYRQGDAFAFMDLESYDQFDLDVSLVGEAAGFLLENLELRALLFNDKVIGLDLPLAVSETAPAIKGARAQAQLKRGDDGDGHPGPRAALHRVRRRIRVDTRDGERAK